MNEENFRVAVRVRPMAHKELEKGMANVWNVSQSCLQSEGRSFAFERIFHSGQSNEAVFESLGESLVWGAMGGVSACLMCYGQTGSGKTYTMHGQRPNFPGILPLSIETIFAFVHETVDKEFMVRCSYLEIFNESINDLLDLSKINLEMKEGPEGIEVLGLTEQECVSMNQVYALLALGDAHKQVLGMSSSSKSSQSHTIFRIVAESKFREAEGGYTRASIDFIDMAGSEGIDTFVKGDVLRTQELKFINKSLITLNAVISSLSEKSAQVPYSHSKLTRYLRPHLETATRVSLILTISPSSESLNSSLSTLELGQKVKSLKARISRQSPDPSTLEIQNLQISIKALQSKLHQTESALSKFLSSPQLNQEIEYQGDKASPGKSSKSRFYDEFESLMIEKTRLQSLISKQKACILVSENIPMKAVEASGVSPSERRVNRLTFARDPRENEEIGERNRTESILALSHEEFFTKTGHSPDSARDMKRTICEMNSPSIDLSNSYTVRDTMLLDKIENFNDLFDGFNMRTSMAYNFSAIKQSFAVFANEKKEEENLPSREQLVAMVGEQDRIIESMQKELYEKGEEVDVLKDELNLCRNNMKVLQMKLRESRK